MRSIVIAVWIVVLFSSCSLSAEGVKLPELWIKYVERIYAYFTEYPQCCFPQVIYPNQMILMTAREKDGITHGHTCCLPLILVWDPLKQFPLYFSEIKCFTCGSNLYQKRWNICQDISSQPRTLQDIEGFVILFGVVYSCDNQHNVLSYDPRLLNLFPNHFAIPFVLSHRTGFTKRLLDFIFAHIEQGLDFSKTIATIEAVRSNFIQHASHHYLQGFKYPAMISRFTITSLFLQNFFLRKENAISDDMRELTSDSGWISIDHTFKVMSNIGYFRSDKKWITQYNSLFIVLNELGQVLTWQFTKTEASSEVRDLLTALFSRFIRRGSEASIHSVILDNCCQWRPFLQSVFGNNVSIKLDLFHAVQRISRTLLRKERYYSQFLSELRMVFRRAGDVATRRTMPTPDTTAISENLNKFIERWMNMADLRSTTIKELNNLKKHIACLSNIPPGIGTNRNEALHRFLNPYFNSKTRLGVQTGYALLCVLFWLHNKKISSKATSICSSISHDHTYIKKELFGVVSKEQSPQSPSANFWGSKPLMTFEESEEAINDIEDFADSSDSISSKFTTTLDAKVIIDDALNTTRMIDSCGRLFCNSPLLKNEFLPFIDDCNRGLPHDNLLDSDNAGIQSSDHGTNEQRLNDVISVCGMTKIPVAKDGNCCFFSVASALKVLYTNANTPELKDQLKSLPVDVEGNIGSTSLLLRQLVYEEWVKFKEQYQDYLVGSSLTNLEYEASRFLTPGFFLSALGDTVVSALCNALGIPIIVLTSIPGTPILQFKPRSFLVHAPIIIAYNQAGAGHYDFVSYTTNCINPLEYPVEFRKSNRKSQCKCGINDKEKDKNRCCPNEQYETRCPCFKKNTKCSTDCLCKNCNNPYGKKSYISLKKRRRQAHQLQVVNLRNREFLSKRNESISKGAWSVMESVVLRKVTDFVKTKKSSIDVKDIHQAYSEIVEVIESNNLALPIGHKSITSILYKTREQKKTFETFGNSANLS